MKNKYLLLVAALSVTTHITAMDDNKKSYPVYISLDNNRHPALFDLAEEKTIEIKIPDHFKLKEPIIIHGIKKVYANLSENIDLSPLEDAILSIADEHFESLLKPGAPIEQHKAEYIKTTFIINDKSFRVKINKPASHETLSLKSSYELLKKNTKEKLPVLQNTALLTTAKQLLAPIHQINSQKNCIDLKDFITAYAENDYN